ncbi:MAG: hypothetical protein ACP5EN_09105 [Rhodovulum sp.]
MQGIAFPENGPVQYHPPLLQSKAPDQKQPQKGGVPGVLTLSHGATARPKEPNMSHRQKTTTHRAQMAVVRAFFFEHASALLNASLLLGGEPAYRRSQALIEDIRQGTKMTRRMRERLVDLHALLALQNVGDPERVETACFAAIDPADPIVEDLCLLADALYDLLVAIAQDETAPVANADIGHVPCYKDAA